MIGQISLIVSLPGVDLPDGAVLCLANPDFSSCAPLLPSPVASAHPALLLQATDTYIATFVDIPEGTYALTIPPIGSFAGYRGTITIDRDMPAVIAIELPAPPEVPGIPSVPGDPGDPGAPGVPAGPEPPEPAAATQTVDAPVDPVPASGMNAGPRAGPLATGDGTSGDAGTMVESAPSVGQAAGVTALPATGTGRATAPGIIPLGTLTALSMLVLLWAIRAGSRVRNHSSFSPGNDD